MVDLLRRAIVPEHEQDTKLLCYLLLNRPAAIHLGTYLHDDTVRTRRSRSSSVLLLHIRMQVLAAVVPATVAVEIPVAITKAAV